MCEGYELSFSLDVELVNGTLTPVLRPVITKCSGPIVAAVFLSLIFLGAFLLNMMVVVTIATSYTLKRYLYCHLVMNLCIACWLDCILNLSIAIGYVATAPWRFGYIMSYINGFTINMLNSAIAFAVLMLALDRLAAAKKYASYLNMEKYKLGIIIGAMWFIAFMLASPLVCGYIFSIPYRNRYSCSVADPRDDYYLIIHILLIVCAPTIAMIVLVIVTSVTFHRERRKQRKIKGNKTVGYFDQILMTPYFRTEFYPAVFMICAVIAYILLWLPFTSLTTINPILTKHWANDTEEGSEQDAYSRLVPAERSGFMRRAMIDESQLRSITNRTMSGNMTADVANGMANFTMDMEEGLIPEIVDTPVHDTVFIWFRFVFDILIPILVFIVVRDIRAKFEGLIMCCRPNSVDVASPKPIKPPYINRLPSTGAKDQKEGAGKAQKQKNSNKNVIGFKTPILFATSEGLHIRTIEETYLDMMENKPLIPGFSRPNPPDPVFMYGLCDVVLGYEDLTDFDGQFHIDDNYDYDREANGDLGGSNPVVMGANRVAIGQKSQPPNDPDDDIPIKYDFRPPTPPKVQVVGNEPAVNFGDTIELEDEEQEKRKKKGRKSVRFATMLNEEIPRPSTAESSVLESSAGSTRSSDSGIMADNENSSSKLPEDKRKQRFSIHKDRQRTSKNLPANSIPRPRIPQRNPPAASRKPSTIPVPGKGKKGTGTKVRNIKSRHINELDGSLTSLESKQEPRRFSKPSND